MVAPRIRRARNLRETFTPQALENATIQNALQALADAAMAGKARVVKRYNPSVVKTFVGEQQGRLETSVRLGESIRYEFEYMKSIAMDAWKILRLNSPVHVSPTKGWETKPDNVVYRDSHIILADGIAYDNPAMIPDDVTEVIITNLTPYSRKVEMRGWHKTTSVNFHMPYHTYELSAKELRKYANVVNVKFIFVDMPGFAIGKGSRHGAKRSDQARAIRYPALRITLRG
jgi:hypothetical protein